MIANSSLLFSSSLILVLILTNITGTLTRSLQYGDKQVQPKAYFAFEVDTMCGVSDRNRIRVTNRTSNSFTAVINYNCSFNYWHQFYLSSNKTQLDNCSVDVSSYDGMMTVSCPYIYDSAGRDLTFTVIPYNDPFIRNETFIVTLTPLNLQVATNISINLNSDQTEASIFVDNCHRIADISHLFFHCHLGENGSNALLDDCTYKCSSLEPGLDYTSCLVRSPIQIKDKEEYELDNMFSEEVLCKTYQTELGQVENITFVDNPVDVHMIDIHFVPPTGYYEQIHIVCVGEDQACQTYFGQAANLTGICSSCTYISVHSFVRGMKYNCWATTKKAGFNDRLSDAYTIPTDLMPIIYTGVDLFNAGHVTLDVTPQSDFHHLRMICEYQYDLSLCSYFTTAPYFCSTIFDFYATRGCQYRCHFVTQKNFYEDVNSIQYTFTFFPPKPRVIVVSYGTRWIYIHWTLNDSSAYIQSFTLQLNYYIYVYVANSTVSYHNLTYLLPNTRYRITVTADSFLSSTSDEIDVTTRKSSPPLPSPIEIETKIVTKNDDYESTSYQQVFEIDESLFSNENDPVLFYLIYVRQDHTNSIALPYSIGTYLEAQKNPLLDYFAVLEYVSDSWHNLTKFNEKSRIVIGKETCSYHYNPYTPCNGKLKPNTFYKIIVAGCTNPMCAVSSCTIDDCTYVISKSFQTIDKTSSASNKSRASVKAWIAAVPIGVVVIVITGVCIWKWHELRKRFIKRKRDDQLTFSQLKAPKSLTEYINLTDEKKQIIAQEFENLNKSTWPLKRSFPPTKLDRYKDISSRGPWKNTAVHIKNANRRDSYVNANEIQGANNEVKYIACQAPMLNTCEDFWNMIIQYKMGKIVMLNQFEKEGTQRDFNSATACFPYIPMNVGETVRFNNIEINLTDIQYYLNNELEIRRLIVQKNGALHHVVHFMFMKWLRGAAIHSRTLIDLIDIVNQYQNSSIDLSSPIAVHCSSGTGRTGTYIAVDIIIRLIDQTNQNLAGMTLDILGIVSQLRHERIKMVETKEQYLLIHNCVEEYLTKTNRLDLIKEEPHVYEPLTKTLTSASEHNYTNVIEPKVDPPIYYGTEKMESSMSKTCENDYEQMPISD